MKPNSRLQAVAAVVGGAALAAMGALAVTGGLGTAADVATINAPEAPAMTLGQTVTSPTTTTTTVLSFRPSVTATPPPLAEPGG